MSDDLRRGLEISNIRAVGVCRATCVYSQWFEGVGGQDGPGNIHKYVTESPKSTCLLIIDLTLNTHI